MSETKLGRRRRERIAARAGYCCSYCRSNQAITGTTMQVDHIQPESRGGTSDDTNLC
jgi:5-methylcytosine-specific restriction endonuclease McrA